MEIRIQDRNWTTKLAAAINDSCDGDIIIVNTPAQKELGERAKLRLCPRKRIIFKVEQCPAS